MASDDLNAPLGQKSGQTKKKWQSKISAAAPQVLAGMLGLFGLAVAGWAMFVNDPLGGEPVAVIATKLPVASPAKQNNDGDGKQHAHHDGVTDAAPDAAAVAAAAAAAAKIPTPDAKTVTIIDGSNGKSRDVVIPGNPGAAPKATIDP